MDKSDHKLEPFIDLKNGLYMFTYAHRLIVEPDGNESHEFEHIVIDAPTRDSAIAGLIARRFTLADEIALINNKLSARPGAGADYDSYLSYRAECYAIADASIAGYEAAE